MRFKIIAVLSALAGLVASQAEMPGCATSCASMAVGGLTHCRNEDFKCICETESFIRDIAKCITKMCDPEEIEMAVNYSRLLCANAGVILPTNIVGSALAAATSKATKTQATLTMTTTADAGETNKPDSAGVKIGEGCVVMAAGAAMVGALIGL